MYIKAYKYGTDTFENIRSLDLCPFQHPLRSRVIRIYFQRLPVPHSRGACHVFLAYRSLLPDRLLDRTVNHLFYYCEEVCTGRNIALRQLYVHLMVWPSCILSSSDSVALNILDLGSVDRTFAFEAIYTITRHESCVGYDIFL
jgi:hypothetical protein